jgi:ketol-acid reductoisomerase
MIYMFGYGIQGRAHAQNLRDSGSDIVVINRGDEYLNRAIEDGFTAINRCAYESLNDGDILYILIPEEGHKELLTELIANVDKEVTVVFAHGFTLVDETVFFPDNWDILMIAPRYPGAQVRGRYLQNHGVPAYINVTQDSTGQANETLDILCAKLGFDKGGTLEVSAAEETLVDLAIENVMAPSFFIFVQKLFAKLVERGVRPEVACMELYYSGETGAVRTAMSKFGLYKGLQLNASPTCQFGVSSSAHALDEMEWVDEFIDSRLDRIESGKFSIELNDYPNVVEVKDQFFDSAISHKIRESEARCNAVFGGKV